MEWFNFTMTTNYRERTPNEASAGMQLFSFTMTTKYRVPHPLRSMQRVGDAKVRIPPFANSAKEGHPRKFVAILKLKNVCTQAYRNSTNSFRPE